MAGMSSAERQEITREIMALREQMTELERRADLGNHQWLAGIGRGRCQELFVDGTWIDEDDPTNDQYATDQTNFHGDPGLQADFDNGSGGTGRRRLFLRLSSPIFLPPDRLVSFVIFFDEIVGDVNTTSGNSNEIPVMLETIAALDQATLQALTWNNQGDVSDDPPVPAGDRSLGRLIHDTGPDDKRATAAWDNRTNGNPSGASDPCASITVHFKPAAALTIEAIRIYFDTSVSAGGGPDTQGSGKIMRTRVGDPHRSYLLIE